MNGIELDINIEESFVELFAENIMFGGEIVLENPVVRNLMPNWSRVRSAVPFIYDKLIDAVERDNA